MSKILIKNLTNVQGVFLNIAHIAIFSELGITTCYRIQFQNYAMFLKTLANTFKERQ